MDSKEYTLKLLASHDRTEKELRDKLAAKGFSAEDIDSAITFASEYNYINDRSYADKYISDGIKLRRHGFTRIRTELLRRGVDRDTVDEAIESARQSCEISPREQIEAVLDSRFSGADLSNPKERNRIFAYFARRGFSFDDIRGAINSKSAFKDLQWEE